MRCDYCGHALSNNSPLCPHCGMMMNEDQLKRRKQMNGNNNAYMERLNQLNRKKIEDKIEENGKPNIIKGDLIIAGIILVVLIIAVIVFLKNR